MLTPLLAEAGFLAACTLMLLGLAALWLNDRLLPSGATPEQVVRRRGRARALWKLSGSLGLMAVTLGILAFVN